MIQVIKDANFYEKMARHEEAMKTNEHYRDAFNSLTQPVGKKLELTIEVTDEYFSHHIMDLLHGKIPGSELLGFKVTEVCMFPETKKRQVVVQELQKLIQEINSKPYSQ